MLERRSTAQEVVANHVFSLWSSLSSLIVVFVDCAKNGIAGTAGQAVMWHHRIIKQRGEERGNIYFERIN
jgi:hypothetical protein